MASLSKKGVLYQISGYFIGLSKIVHGQSIQKIPGNFQYLEKVSDLVFVLFVFVKGSNKTLKTKTKHILKFLQDGLDKGLFLQDGL